jgi:hypothetical protein
MEMPAVIFQSQSWLKLVEGGDILKKTGGKDNPLKRVSVCESEINITFPEVTSWLS